MTPVGPRLQLNWDWRAAGNFIGGGSGTGLVTVAALGTLFGDGLRPAIAMALLLIAAGLGLVWLEIGRPWRFLNVYRQPGRSWMTREAYAALPVFAAGAAALWLGAATAVVFAALFGLVFLYCQARILNAAKGIPAWREPALMPLIIVTGLTEGAGFFVLITLLDGGSPVWSAVALALLLIGRIVLGSFYRRRLTASGCPAQTAAVLDRYKAAFLALGHLLPLAALGIGWVIPTTNVAMSVLASICAVAGGWALKFVIVTRAAHTQGFALPHTPARGPVGSGGRRAKPGWAES